MSSAGADDERRAPTRPSGAAESGLGAVAGLALAVALAGVVAPGDRVFTESGAWARVVSNQPGARQAYVHNLVVDDDHTFFVGETGAWVHNCRLAQGPRIAFEMNLVKRGEGSRRAHNRQANAALERAMAGNTNTAKTLRSSGVRVPRNLDRSPKGSTWHHVPDRPGVMQLVLHAHHRSRFVSSLHPEGVGGFKLWGHLYQDRLTMKKSTTKQLSKPTTIADAVKNRVSLDEDATIYARRPWTADAACVVESPKEDGGTPDQVKASGYEYFLEVFVVFEVLEAFTRRKPTLEEEVRAVLYYAEYDAWPAWVADFQ